MHPRTLFSRSIAGALSRVALLASASCLAAQATPSSQYVADDLISVPAAAGKFDFLQVDTLRHRLLAAHEKDGTLDVFDLDSRRLITRLKLGAAVEAIVDPSSGNYIVSLSADKKIVIVDSSNFSDVAEISMEGELDAILFDPRNRRIFSAHDNGKYLWAIDADSRKVVAAIDLPGAPECMVYDATADRVYLNIKTSNQVAVIDPNKNVVVALWPIAPAESPRGIALDKIRRRIYVAGGNGKLVAIDTKTGRIASSVDTAQDVDQAAFDSKTSRIFCAGAEQMSVVEATDSGLKLLENLATNITARNVAADPKTGKVWTTYTDGKNSYAKSWKQR